ncbi:MAG: winged helix-turn-helix transcriptional regulator [Candidatus Micrarchaeota archaeon]|nr:winged helix-turn-helix transcriptional regulator [Candidatus Micrarchaeota archaeon]
MEKQVRTRTKLKAQESYILKTLLEHDYELSTTEAAKIAGVSWNTAKRYLEKFHNEGWIEKSKVGNRDYWRAYRVKQKA